MPVYSVPAVQEKFKKGKRKVAVDRKDQTDLVLATFKRQCEGKSSRIESKTGPVVSVKEVFRNPKRSGLIDARVIKPDGSEDIVPMTSLFVV